MRASQPPGFSGVTPISNLELWAWVQLTGNRLRREEVAVLKMMDGRYCHEIDLESEAIRQRETGAD